MKRTYVLDPKTRKLVEKTPKLNKGVVMLRDLPGYRSPLGTGWIEGRRARREDMARGGVREVDPSERVDMGPKTQADASRERAQLAARPSHSMSPQAIKRLMDG